MKLAGYSKSIKRLIENLKKMPGIGPRSAERIAFFLLNTDPASVIELAQAMVDARQTMRFCKECYNITDKEVCDICSSGDRDKGILCVVEQPKDIIAIEKSGGYRGVYHVLLGVLSPLEGITPSDLRIKELINRIKGSLDTEPVREVIIATGFDTEGETTALYLIKILKDTGINITRLSHGIPFGGKLEYSDSATMVRAFEGRNRV